MNPLAVSAPSAAKVTEATQDLQRFLLGFEQRWRVGADAAQRVSPIRAWRALGMGTECRWIKEDPLAFDLLNHRALCQDVLERLAAGQASALEVETAELGQRMILVANRRADPVFGAQVTHEDRDDQGIGFVAGQLHKAGSAQGLAVVIPQVPEEFHLKQPAGLRAGNPGRATPPRTGLGKHIELFVDTLESMLGQAM